MDHHFPTPSSGTTASWGRRLAHYPIRMELSILAASSLALAFAIANCATYPRFDRYVFFWNLPTPAITVFLSALHLVFYTHNNQRDLHSSRKAQTYTSPKSPTIRSRPAPEAFHSWGPSWGEDLTFTFTTPTLTPAYTATLSVLFILAWALQLRYSASFDYYMVVHPGRHHKVHTEDIVLTIFKISAFIVCGALYVVYGGISAWGMTEANLRGSKTEYGYEKVPREDDEDDYRHSEPEMITRHGLAIRLVEES